MSLGKFNLSRWAIDNVAITRYLMIALMVLGSVGQKVRIAISEKAE